MFGYAFKLHAEKNPDSFIWDVFSLTCLKKFKLNNFSIIYHIAQASSQKVFLAYGINNLYEASIQLVDWESEVVLGNCSMMHSGCWKIKDMH